MTQEEQRALDVEREALREVATSFLRAVEARERAEAAGSGKHLADEALRIAERRYAAGDVAQLDVNLVRTAVARADAEMRIANAALTGPTPVGRSASERPATARGSPSPSRGVAKQTTTSVTAEAQSR